MKDQKLQVNENKEESVVVEKQEEVVSTIYDIFLKLKEEDPNLDFGYGL